MVTLKEARRIQLEGKFEEFIMSNLDFTEQERLLFMKNLWRLFKDD